MHWVPAQPLLPAGLFFVVQVQLEQAALGFTQHNLGSTSGTPGRQRREFFPDSCRFADLRLYLRQGARPNVPHA